MAENQLIIFVKNPIPGTVKTRIARIVGNEIAAEVYRYLLNHTRQVVSRFLTAYPAQAFVYYADFVADNDEWQGYRKQPQRGADLGERMKTAFEERFEAGAKRVVIIGSDCLQLEAPHLEAAFDRLADDDVVLGPAADGGYYLLGMRRFVPFLFENKPWSQAHLLSLTRQELATKAVSHSLLEVLSDVDEWEDVTWLTPPSPTSPDSGADRHSDPA